MGVGGSAFCLEGGSTYLLAGGDLHSRWTDKHEWKHYLPAISFAGGNYLCHSIFVIEIFVFSTNKTDSKLVKWYISQIKPKCTVPITNKISNFILILMNFRYVVISRVPGRSSQSILLSHGKVCHMHLQYLLNYTYQRLKSTPNK